MLRRARAQDRQLVGGRQQRILQAFLAAQQRIEVALAHAERRERHGPRLHRRDGFLHGHRAEWQERPPVPRDGLQRLVPAVLEPRHMAEKLHRLLERDLVGLHHVQRIFRFLHVQLGDVSPRAADRIEQAAFAALQHLRGLHLLAANRPAPWRRSRRNLREPQAAERQRDAVRHLRALDVDEFERAAAEVPGDAVGLVIAADDAVGRIAGLFLAGKDPDPATEDLFRAPDEVRAVRRLARGGRRQHVHLPCARLFATGRGNAAARRALARCLPRPCVRWTPVRGRGRTAPSR